MNKKYKYRCLGYAEVDQDIWFANLNFNALMKLDRLNGRIEIVDRFPNYGIEEEWLYSAVCYVNGYLVFVPNGSKEIAAYHIKKRQFISIDLDCSYIGEKKPYFVNAYVYQHYVYMFPTGASCMVRYDVIEHTVQYMQNCIKDLINGMSDSSYCFYQQFEVVDEKIYIPFLELNAVAVFDLKSEAVNIRYMDIEGGCSTIKYVNGFFYLSSWRSHKIYRWDHKAGKTETYQEFPDGFAGDYLFFGACNVGEAIVFFPDQCNMIVSFSPETKKMQKIKKVCKYDDESILTYFIHENGGINYILMADMECINCIRYEAGKIEIIPCYGMEDPYNKRQISRFLIKNKYYNMAFEWNGALEEYLEILANTEETECVKGRFGYGKRIFEEIRIKD